MRNIFGRRRALRGAVTAVLATGAVACSDPLEPEAFLETVETTFTLHALNGSPPSAPAAAVLVNRPAAVRIGSSFSFDFAMDIAPDGTARLYPVDVVASNVVVPPSRAVGFQLVTGQSYDQLLLAPNSGYTYEEPIPVAVGDVGYIQSNAHPVCSSQFTYSPTVYAKFRVDAIDVAARTVRLTVRSDPNCGFRELDPGVPGE